MLARLIATVAALLLACASPQAQAHVRAPERVSVSFVDLARADALENTPPAKSETNPKTAPPARATSENLASGKNAALSHWRVCKNWSPEPKCTSTFGVTGYQKEAGNLYQAVARFYRPGTGRFLSQDPWEGDVKNPASLNPYIYGYGNPGSFIDPDGRCPIPSLCAYGFARNDEERLGALRSFANSDPTTGRVVGVGARLAGPVIAANTARLAIEGDPAARTRVSEFVGAAGEFIKQRLTTLATQGAAELVRQDVVTLGTGIGESYAEAETAGDRGDYVGQGMAGFDTAAQVAAAVPAAGAPVLLRMGRGNVARVQVPGTKPTQLAEAPDGSVGVRFYDVDGEAGIGQIEHPLAQPSRHGDFHGPWREVPDDNFSWKAYLERESGSTAPAGMPDPHAHHVLQKRGRPGVQRDLVLEGQDLLQRRAGIDPVYGLENLVWAPNRVAGQHSTETLRRVVGKVRELDSANATPQDFLKALEVLGKEAADRR